MDIGLSNVTPHGRCYIGIAAQQEYIIGLFELLRIQQDNDGEQECIIWIRSAQSPFSAWVHPVATLENDFSVYGPERNNITLLNNNLQLNTSGRIQRHLLTPAHLTRIQYTVSFWEQTEIFPVYTLYPDTGLPWQHTIRSAFQLPLADWRSLPRPLVRSELNQQRRSTSERPRRLSEGAVCPISLESLTMEDAYWTPCGHAFSAAICHALAADARCPLCRSSCALEEILRT